jgi:hypothetical protein
MQSTAYCAQSNSGTLALGFAIFAFVMFHPLVVGISRKPEHVIDEAGQVMGRAVVQSFRPLSRVAGCGLPVIGGEKPQDRKLNEQSNGLVNWASVS